MSNKKESSIEWLFLMMYNPNYGHEANQRLLDKAKQLHRQEIIEAYAQGAENEFTMGGVSSSDYYRNTYTTREAENCKE